MRFKGESGVSAIVMFMMIGIMVVIGVNLFKPVNEAVNAITEAPTTGEVVTISPTPTPTITPTGSNVYQNFEVATPTSTPVATHSSTAAALLGILPIIFVAMIILSAVAYMGEGGFSFGFGGGSHKSSNTTIETNVIPSIIKNSKEFIKTIELKSKKFEHYINNLDDILGVKTINSASWTPPLKLTKEGEAYNLYVRDNDYDFYIIDKNTFKNSFTIACLHKEDETKNKAYVITSELNTEPTLEETTVVY